MKKSENKYYSKVIRLIDIAKTDYYSCDPFGKAVNYLIWCKKFKHITQQQFDELTNLICEYMKIYC